MRRFTYIEKKYKCVPCGTSCCYRSGYIRHLGTNKHKNKMNGNKTRYYENKRKRLKYLKEYKIINNDKMLKYQKEYYAKNKEHVKMRVKNNYKIQKEKNKNKYKCEPCNYFTHSKSLYNNHIKTKKHIKKIDFNIV